MLAPKGDSCDEWEMDTPKLALKELFIPGIIPVGSALMKVGLTAMSSQGWFSELPWLWIAAAGAIFWAGVFYAELFNSQSPLRKWIRHYRRMFDLLGVFVGTSVENNNERFAIAAKCRAVRNMEDVRVVLTCQLLVGENMRELASVEIMTKDHVSLTEDFFIELANVPAKQPHATNPCAQLGGLNRTLPNLPENGTYIFEVVVHDKNGRQTFKVYVDFMAPGSRSSGRLSVLTEYDYATQRLIN